MIYLDRFEIDITDTCNFSCRGCAHFSPLYKKNSYTFEEFDRDIQRLSQILHAKFLEFVGGEPTLVGHRLASYVNSVRNSGICDTLGLITNGVVLLNPKYHYLIPLFERVLVSHYESKYFEPLKELEKFPNVCLQGRQNFIKMFDPENPRLTDEQMETNYKQCKTRLTCNWLYKGRMYKCSQSLKTFYMLKHRGIDHEPAGDIGIDIYSPDAEKQLTAYLSSGIPEKACRYCRLGLQEWESWKEEKVK